MKMSENQEHFWHILIFYYKKEKNVAQAKEKICRIYEGDALTKQTAEFHRFRDGNFDVKDALCSDQLIVESKIFQKIEENLHVNSYDIAKELNIIDHKTVLEHLHKLDTQRSSMLSVTWYDAKKFNGSNFFLQIAAETKQNWAISEKIDSNEKWITYDNNRKRSWLKWGTGLTPKKVILYLVGWERNRPLWTAARQNDWFWSLLSN